MSALVEPYRSGGVSRRTLGECTCVIAAEGRFTSRSALLFARELSAARNDGCSDFVFDFADVTGVDSIAAMIFTEQRLELETARSSWPRGIRRPSSPSPTPRCWPTGRCGRPARKRSRRSWPSRSPELRNDAAATAPR